MTRPILVKECAHRPVPTINRFATRYESTHTDRSKQGVIGITLIVLAVVGFVWGFWV